MHDIIWKRLDRTLVNDKWLESMPQTTITNLPFEGSDHCPLLMEMVVRQENTMKYFKFLNCWVDNQSFMETVKACWNTEITGDPMWIFHEKIKRLASTLSSCSKQEYGDIYAVVKYMKKRLELLRKI